MCYVDHHAGASAWGNFGTSGTTPGHGSTLGRGAIGGWEGDESLYEGSAGADPLNASGLGESYVNYDDDVDYDDGTHAPFVTTVQRRLLEQFSTVLSETFTSPFDDADALTDLLVAHIEALRRKAPLLPKARQTEVRQSPPSRPCCRSPRQPLRPSNTRVELLPNRTT